MINTRRLALVGTHLDPNSLLGVVGFNEPVDYTVVGGKVTVQNGKLITIDEEKAFYDADMAVKAYLAR